jgi:hypothetical protein
LIIFIFLIIPSAILFTIDNKNANAMSLLLFIAAIILAYINANRKNKNFLVNLVRKFF